MHSVRGRRVLPPQAAPCGQLRHPLARLAALRAAHGTQGSHSAARRTRPAASPAWSYGADSW